MSIHVLKWIEEDLKAKGDDIRNYTLADLKEMLDEYKKISNR